MTGLIGVIRQLRVAMPRRVAMVTARYLLVPRCGNLLHKMNIFSGYNISDIALQMATSATEEELTEALPQPLAQALIDRRRLPDLRDRLIGMTFLGQPVPLVGGGRIWEGRHELFKK